MTGPEEASDAPASRPVSRTAAVAAVAAVAVAALVLAAIGFYRWGSAGTPAAAPRTAPSSAAPSRTPTPADVYATVAPSVVTIESTPTGSTTVDLGTGVIVNADGTILTALHVVKGAGIDHR